LPRLSPSLRYDAFAIQEDNNAPGTTQVITQYGWDSDLGTYVLL